MKMTDSYNSNKPRGSGTTQQVAQMQNYSNSQLHNAAQQLSTP